MRELLADRDATGHKGPAGRTSVRHTGATVRALLRMCVLSAIAVVGLVIPRSNAQDPYVPQAVFCAGPTPGLCPQVAAYIGPDPALGARVGYPGLFGPLPTSPKNDVETPFDNMAWQMFIALNWAASATRQPPEQGLTVPGLRVWQTYRKVASLFGNSPVTASCSLPPGLPIISIGSDGHGNPMPNNDEYFQAATNLPLIDINGNWTLYERRVNAIEARYLLAPNFKPNQTLTTITGQTNFIKSNPGGAQFTASATTPAGRNGSMELKMAWRIIDQSAGDDPSRYFTQQALLAVPGDLVNNGQKICATVTLGLVSMHIMQRNPVDSQNPSLLPRWIWATFEHVDNVPLAQVTCSVATGCPPNGNWLNQPSCGAAAASPQVRYSFYNPSGPSATNIQPAPRSGRHFPWNSTAPYANGATTPATAMPQATRCWSIYPTTAQINAQWQAALGAVNTPFQNYMLIGTQWGANVEPQEGVPLPVNAVPALLSNTGVETYIQNYTTATNSGGSGSCVGCHSFATLVVGDQPTADFSFLPFLAEPSTARSRIKTPR